MIVVLAGRLSACREAVRPRFRGAEPDDDDVAIEVAARCQSLGRCREPCTCVDDDRRWQLAQSPARIVRPKERGARAFPPAGAHSLVIDQV